MNTEYLAETKTIDYENPIIQEKVSELKAGTASTIEYIQRAYEFVRDEIPHSWDVQLPIVSRKASVFVDVMGWARNDFDCDVNVITCGLSKVSA